MTVWIQGAACTTSAGSMFVQSPDLHAEKLCKGVGSRVPTFSSSLLSRFADQSHSDRQIFD